MKRKLKSPVDTAKIHLRGGAHSKRVMTAVVIGVIFACFTLTAQAASYYVQPGDTLWLIAEQFGVTVEEIKQASGIWYDLLYPGDVLIVPDESHAYRGEPTTSRGGIRPSSQDVQMLAQMIMAEAAGEPYEGKVAVAAVILNRLEHPSFPKTLSGVLYETDAFEPILNGSFYSQGPNAQCVQAATEALAGADPTGGAVYFYNPSTARSSWIFTRPVVKQIGNHVFAK